MMLTVSPSLTSMGETRADADMANVLTMDEARPIASNIAQLPNYLAANPESAND